MPSLSKISIIIVFIVLMNLNVVDAANVSVPGNYSTIQTAINAANRLRNKVIRNTK